MIALVQRVRQAHVDVAGQTLGAIEQGLLVFVCAEPQDGDASAAKLVAKLLKLRIFADDAGKMNRSLQDVAGGLLIVSQFTLAADTSAGNRPSFTAAARRPRSGVRFTSVCWRWRARRIRMSQRASSVPRCRCTWSTTGR